MQFTASVDIGSSAAKGILLDEDGVIVASAYENCAGPLDPVRMKDGIVERLSSLKAAPDRLILTGVGATFPGLYEKENKPSFVQELTAVGEGGLILSGREEALVVSMGTGTAYVYASKKDGIRHLGGSAMGSGTIKGLSGRMLGTQSMTEICALSSHGDANHVDVLLSEVAMSGTDTLTLDLTSSNFAKADSSTSKEDLAAGIMNLVLQNLGVLAVFAAKGAATDTVVLTGGLTAAPDTKPIFQRMEEAFGVHFIIPKYSSYAAVIGAAEAVLGHGSIRTEQLIQNN